MCTIVPRAPHSILQVLMPHSLYLVPWTAIFCTTRLKLRGTCVVVPLLKATCQFCGHSYGLQYFVLVQSPLAKHFAMYLPSPCFVDAIMSLDNSGISHYSLCVVTPPSLPLPPDRMRKKLVLSRIGPVLIAPLIQNHRHWCN